MGLYAINESYTASGKTEEIYLFQKNPYKGNILPLVINLFTSFNCVKKSADNHDVYLSSKLFFTSF